MYDLGSLLPKQSTNESRGYDTLVKNILELAINGVTKKQIIDDFCLSRAQLRRLTAELVSKDFVRYHQSLGTLMTTHGND